MVQSYMYLPVCGALLCLPSDDERFPVDVLYTTHIDVASHGQQRA